jgi:amino-acid N-acetyltransferase
MIRKAKIQEVPEIWRMLHDFADRDVLPRTMADLYSQVREYFVHRQDHGPIIGVAALHIFWQDLGEIRSVAVLPEFQKNGIGSRLVKSCIEEAKSIGLKQVFALTTRPNFFERLGFRIVPNENLPNIIWSECKDCLKYPDKCNEIPMLLDLTASDSGD